MKTSTGTYFSLPHPREITAAVLLGTKVVINFGGLELILDPADAHALIGELSVALHTLDHPELSTLAAQADPDWDADATEPDSGVEAPE